MVREPAAERAARAALGVGPDAGLTAVEAAFRRRVGPLARAATGDASASERLRLLIEARAHLRAVLAERPAAQPREASGAAAPLRPLGFRLAANRRDVEMILSLDALVATAARGETRATLAAPVLRRCPFCVSAGRAECRVCGGDGVVATSRSRSVPLDLARLSSDDFTIEASPWVDAHGRGALGGPLFRATLV